MAPIPSLSLGDPQRTPTAPSSAASSFVIAVRMSSTTYFLKLVVSVKPLEFVAVGDGRRTVEGACGMRLLAQRRLFILTAVPQGVHQPVDLLAAPDEPLVPLVIRP